MAEFLELIKRPEVSIPCGALALIIIMLVALILNMKRREREWDRLFGDMEHGFYDRLSDYEESVDNRMSASETHNGCEQSVRDEISRQLDGLRDQFVSETARAVGEHVCTALEGLGNELVQLNQRLDGLQSAAVDLRQLRERLSMAPRGEMASGQLDALLMQWFAPGRYVRDFEVGAGSGRYADVAILLPDESGKVLYLPVDMSFPVEEFNGEWDDAARARLSQQLAEHAARLASELIKPGLTTDFVIMLLRSELVSARVGELDTALASAQLARQVVAVGPATFWSIARALDGGVSALEMRRSTRQLEQLMRDMRGELGRFTNILDAGNVQTADYQPRRRQYKAVDTTHASPDMRNVDAAEDTDATGLNDGRVAQADVMTKAKPDTAADAHVKNSVSTSSDTPVAQARSARYKSFESDVDIWS